MECCYKNSLWNRQKHDECGLFQYLPAIWYHTNYGLFKLRYLSTYIVLIK